MPTEAPSKRPKGRAVSGRVADLSKVSGQLLGLISFQTGAMKAS